MAAIKKEHYFYPGHKGKTGKIRPGILVIDGKYKFRYNQTNKDQTIYKMYCVQQANPEFSCRAKATVVKRDDDSFSRLPYPVGKSSTIDECILRWFCGSVVSYSISISIRVLEHSRTFYRNS
jgi:hypothetical protein